MAREPLPERASLEYLKKLAKERLRELRGKDPSAKLSSAQLEVAREHGFTSWRALKAEVERRQAAPAEAWGAIAFYPQKSKAGHRGHDSCGHASDGLQHCAAQSEAVAAEELREVDCPAVHVGPVGRTQIENPRLAAAAQQLAVAPGDAPIGQAYVAFGRAPQDQGPLRNRNA